MATLPAGSYQPASISFMDAGGERASMHFYGQIISAANIVAKGAAWATLMTALDALALGTRVEDTYVDKTTYVATRPTNGAAREVAIQFIFQDGTTGQTFLVNLPTVDISLIEYVDNVGARDAVVLSTTEVAAVITALEALPVVNPVGQANTSTVIGARVIRGSK